MNRADDRTTEQNHCRQHNEGRNCGRECDDTEGSIALVAHLDNRERHVFLLQSDDLLHTCETRFDRGNPRVEIHRRRQHRIDQFVALTTCAMRFCRTSSGPSKRRQRIKFFGRVAANGRSVQGA